MKSCQDCGDTIHPKRLLAKPDAIYCVLCQPAYDQRKEIPEHLIAVHGDLDDTMVRGLAAGISQ